jgi:hypothetical protein
MAKKRLPLKPNTGTRFSLDEKERIALCCYCVFECTKLNAFSMAHPELTASPTVLKKKCEEFFSSGDVVGFINEYRAFLDSLAPESKAEEIIKSEPTSEEREVRKRKALEMLADELVDQIYAMRMGDDSIDRETVLKMVDRIGWLGDEEKVQEEPRRYLPTQCYGSCRYRAFVEQECEDLCVYCKYKKYGETNGVHYDSEKQLDIPHNED